jgi:hypothetical protein
MANGWFFRIHEINLSSGAKHEVHRYEFAVGAIITDGVTTRHFGMDPEMDIGY